MRKLCISLVVVALLACARAMTLTYWVPASEKSCFHANVDKVGKKLSFYFAVQKGGNFDIDYTVADPTSRVLFSGTAERQGDFVFTGIEAGEYSFCFSNGMSTFAEKLVDFDIAVESGSEEHVDPRFAQIRDRIIGENKVGEQPDVEEKETPSDVDRVIKRLTVKIDGVVQNIGRSLNYLRARDHRHLETIQSTQNRIFWFAVAESAAIVAVAGLQVMAIHMFFRPSKSRF